MCTKLLGILPLRTISMKPKACPKCKYQRQPEDKNVHTGICPSCGIAYAKWKPPEKSEISIEASSTSLDDGDGKLLDRLKETFLYAKPDVDSMEFWFRVALLAAFTLWGCSFVFGGVDWESVGGSFLHSINLPFHEFGHVLFSPFGRFMAILGGSLFQILMPLIALLSFSIQMRDNFAASIMLWWSGQNFIDVAPYIADAPYRALPLILGLGEESHDWGNLLTMTNQMDNAAAIANMSFFIGTIVMIAGVAWGAFILKQQYEYLEADD